MRQGLLFFIVLLGGCGGGASTSVVSSTGVTAAAAFAEILYTWRSDLSALELRVQVRNGSANGDILRFDAGDTLRLKGTGALNEITPSYGADLAPGWTAKGLQYQLAASGLGNEARELVWARGDEVVQAVALPAVAQAAFKSYEYCHSVLGSNYSLVRFVGDAPAAPERVCGTIRRDCIDSCESLSSCSVSDYRLHFNDLDDNWSTFDRVRVRVTREVTAKVAGFKGGSVTARYDTGELKAKDDGYCLKP